MLSFVNTGALRNNETIVTNTRHYDSLQKALEEKNITAISSELEWIPSTTVPVSDEQAEDISKLIERLEEDEDVNKVFHNMG